MGHSLRRIGGVERANNRGERKKNEPITAFKKNVLQSRKYISAAFAALSLSPALPGVHDSNMTLANKLSNVLYVQRAMMRLQPEVRAR